MTIQKLKVKKKKQLTSKTNKIVHHNIETSVEA